MMHAIIKSGRALTVRAGIRMDGGSASGDAAASQERHACRAQHQEGCGRCEQARHLGGLAALERDPRAEAPIDLLKISG